MKERMRRLLYGRYGLDELGRFLNILILIFLALGFFVLPQMSTFGLAILIYEYFRMFSRNIYKRSLENQAYLRLRGRIAGRFSTQRQKFRQRKTYRFYRCPSCRQTLRVPRGKGKLSLTCPKCRAQFIKKS